MRDSLNRKAVKVRGAHPGDVIEVATTTGSVSYNFPARWKGRYVTLQVIGDDIKYQLGDADDALTVAYTAAATGTPPNVTPNPAAGAPLTDGQSLSVFIQTETQIAIIGSAGGGTFCVYPSSQKDSDY